MGGMMNREEYDVAVIGAGVSGAATAWTLSRYDLRTVVLEKEADACFGVSKANSGIVHAGFHHDLTSLKSRLEVRGNLMFERLQFELGFPFRRNGILVVAFSHEEMEVARRLYEQGVANGVPGMELCGRERMLALEPKLNPDVTGGLYAPTGGTIEPYRFVFSLLEAAQRNGTAFKPLFKVTAARRDGDLWLIRNPEGTEIAARYVVNAAGLWADDISRVFGGEVFAIHPRKGEEYLLDRNSKAYTRHVLFPVPTRSSKGMLVIPTVEGTTMVGPTAEAIEDKNDVGTTADNLQRIFTSAAHMVSGISSRDIITAFAGLRPAMDGDDFYIDISAQAPGLIQVAGIQSPGLTASPAIGEYVKDLLKKAGLKLVERDEIKDPAPPLRAVRKESPEGVEKLHADDPSWGNIVCRCESISEAEIVIAIRRGHTTVDGIKFYTRAGMGRCQGGFCSYKILKLIARETGVPIEEITKRGPGSRIVTGRLSELDVERIKC